LNFQTADKAETIDTGAIIGMLDGYEDRPLNWKEIGKEAGHAFLVGGIIGALGGTVSGTDTGKMRNITKKPEPRSAVQTGNQPRNNRIGRVNGTVLEFAEGYRAKKNPTATDIEVLEQYESFREYAKGYDTVDTGKGPMTRNQLKKLLVPQHSEQEIDWLVDGLLDEQERTREREVKAAAALEKNTAGTYTESKRVSNVSSEAPLRDSGRQNVTYDPERAASRTGEDAEKLPEQEVNHASADSEIESLAFEAKPISSRELGVPGGTDRQNIRLVEWGETESTWMARQMAEHQGLKLVLFVGDDLEIAHNGKIVRTQSYMDADNVYIRADHPVYTAEQLMRQVNDRSRLVVASYAKNTLEDGKLFQIRTNPDKIELVLQFFANKGIAKQNNEQLRKSIKSWENVVDEHTDKLKYPELYDKTWNIKDERWKAGLLRHWEKEIRTAKRNIMDAKKELLKRGEAL